MKEKPKVKVYDPITGENKYIRSYDEANAVDTYANIPQHFRTFLKGNPFLYNSLQTAFSVNSIEEYFVVYQKKEVQFGDIVHNDDVSFSKRKKIVKKVFRNWNKDFKLKKKLLFNDNNGIIEYVNDVQYLKLGFWMKLLLIICLIVMALITGASSGVFLESVKADFAYRINIVLVEGFKKYDFIRLTNSITIYLLVITLIYTGFYNIISKDFFRLQKYSKEMISSSSKKVDRNYNKRFRKVRRYYLKNLSTKKNIFPSYGIDKIEEGKLSLLNIENISKLTLTKATKYKKMRLFYVITKDILVISSTLGVIIVLGYVLYEILRNLLV